MLKSGASRTVLAFEKKLLTSGVETFIAGGSGNETRHRENHQLNVNKLLKLCQNDSELSGLWNRISKAVKQVM